MPRWPPRTRCRSTVPCASTPDRACSPAPAVRTGLVEMDFPGDRLTPVSASLALSQVLRTNDLYELAVGRFLVVELGSAADVRTLHPDMAGVAGLHEHGVIVTAPGDREGIDVVSRVFVPRMGIPEDPVTGSAHCTLAGFWCERLGRDAFVAEQASARGGILQVRLVADRVILGGRATTVWSGTLHATP
jgi:predicted PhzF superfamily epimerase YddE/YHI9